MIDNIRFWKGSNTIGLPLALFQAAERDWSLVYFQPERPVLEGELNLIQQTANRRLRDLLRGIYPAGGVLKSFAPSATGTANEIRLHTLNKPFYAIFDGLMKPVYAYDDPASSSPSVGGNRVTLPAYTAGSYDELVYLEVWFEEVMSPEGDSGPGGTADTVVYQYGMVGNFTLNNDIKVPVVPLAESTRRVQLRGQIKVVQASTLAGVLARGEVGYGYGLVSDTNFYRAGSGDATSGEDLNTVDGYAYAMPLVLIDRNASVVANTDISLATDVIPTGSDVSGDIVALEGRMDTAEGNITGLDGRIDALADSGAVGDTVHADRVDTGVLHADRIPNLSANKITSDTLGTARIPNLDAAKITTGIFATGRIPNLDAAKITSGAFASSRLLTETGVWTPEFNPTSSSVWTYTKQDGVFVRVGPLVFASFDLEWSNYVPKATISSLYIGDLPRPAAYAVLSHPYYTQNLAWETGSIDWPEEPNVDHDVLGVQLHLYTTAMLVRLVAKESMSSLADTSASGYVVTSTAGRFRGSVVYITSDS